MIISCVNKFYFNIYVVYVLDSQDFCQNLEMSSFLMTIYGIVQDFLCSYNDHIW